MNSKPEVTSEKDITRIGILLSYSDELDSPALRYLILHLNTLQHSFEYEILPYDSKDEFLRTLFSERRVLDREKMRGGISQFVQRYRGYLYQINEQTSLKEPPPERFVLISMARFSNNYYSLREKGVSVLALGNWKRTMAPPSILEFILTMILRQSVAFISHAPVHLGTKGCLFDFNPYLEDVRLKVLQGFICNYCRAVLVSDGFPKLADELTTVLDKKWFGKSTDPLSPAGIVSNLGYNLFLNKGLKPTARETFLTTLQKEGVGQFLSIVGAVVLALLLLWLGLS